MLTFHFAAGELPKELGSLVNLNSLDLSDNTFQGELYVPIHAFVCLLTFSLFAGELPKELGQLTNLTYFDVNNNVQYEKDEDGDDDYDRPIPGTGFTGESLYAPADMYCVFADIHLCVAEELPKELGNLVNLKVLGLQLNGFTGTIVCPTYIRCVFADISTFLQDNCPRSSANS